MMDPTASAELTTISFPSSYETEDNEVYVGNDFSTSGTGNVHSANDIISPLIPHVLRGNWGNLSVPLSDWQKSQLEDLSEPGVRCLLSMWLLNQKHLPQGLSNFSKNITIFVVKGFSLIFLTCKYCCENNPWL